MERLEMLNRIGLPAITYGVEFVQAALLMFWPSLGPVVMPAQSYCQLPLNQPTSATSMTSV